MSPKSYHDYARITGDSKQPDTIDDFEDGDTSEYVYTDLNDGGAGYYFISQTDDVQQGNYAGEYYLEGSGTPGGKREERLSIDKTVTNPSVTWAFKQFHSTNGQVDYEADAILQLDCELSDSTTEVINYQFGSVTRSDQYAATHSPENLYFVLDQVASSSWVTVTRDINADLTNNGYSEVTKINDIVWQISVPGAGNGSDEIGVRMDDLSITNE